MCIAGGGGGGFPPRSEEPGPESDTIFVSGMGMDVDKQRIADFFGQIGIIKVSLQDSILPFVDQNCLLGLRTMSLTHLAVFL